MSASPTSTPQSRRRRRRRAGFTLLEVLASLGILVSIGVVATGAGTALTQLARAARAESVGLLLAEEKIEELLSLPGSLRRSGNDEVRISGLVVRRIWRLENDSPEVGLDRIEVSTSWTGEQITVLNLVAVAS